MARQCVRTCGRPRRHDVAGRRQAARHSHVLSLFGRTSAGILIAAAAFMRTALALSLFLGSLSFPAVTAAQFPYPPIQYPYRYATLESDLRIVVKPKDAAVYVDGYFAGKVEEFDGAFQRLHVEPGQHEITIYLEGYRSMKQRLYLSPRGSRKIEGALERLAPGEAVEPPPAPVDPPDRSEPSPAPKSS
ncbi:MAG: PEGA domain-containing protein [Luteitalea sp.]|nr:PEGA domain-containing protein [Luteitalea sp.]